MRAKRTILFRIGAILLLLVIAGIMMVIGRGHTVYIDNKSIDYNGQTYTTPYKVCLLYTSVFSPKAEWNGSNYTNVETGVKLDNVFLVYQDTDVYKRQHTYPVP